MATTVDDAVPTSGLVARGLWQRQLNHYPDTGRRVLYLGIVVLATIMLYYELYIPGAVSPTIIASYHMTFSYYVYIIVIGNAVGAFGSLLAGLADRWGRANLVAYGLVVTALLVLLGIPNAPNKVTYGVIYGAIAVVEGVILVATPALIRDFSPQLGRASAMGFWPLGRVVGSLVVAIVSTNTLSHLHAWQDQFVICGIAGLVVGVIAVVALRELSPGLRDQLMVSARDRALIEARAKGIDLSESLKHPWRQMLHLDVIGSAFAISVFLIIYYTAVGFFTVYFSSLFGYSLTKANGLGNWFWAFDAGALIVVGIISDRLKVRKPFMVLGAVGAIIMTIIFGSYAGKTHTSYATFALTISLMAGFAGTGYAPWMASFTETVEKHNPALTATGLAVWGWIIRVVIAVSTLVLPFVVSSMTPLVTYGNQVAALSTRYAQQLTTGAAIDPPTATALKATPTDKAAEAKAVADIVQVEKVTPAVAIQRFAALATVPKADSAFLAAHGTQVENASKAAAGQWKNWWGVAVGGEVVFIPLIFLMTGRWDPRKARRDADLHEQQVQEELAALRSE